MKKKYIIALVVGIMILLGIIIGVAVIGKDNNTDPNYKVHEADDDTVEIESENGLQESESEDGPILEENNMIDFNGDASEKSEKDDKTDVITDKDGEKEDYTEEPKESEELDEPETSETGKWGTFY